VRSEEYEQRECKFSLYRQMISRGDTNTSAYRPKTRVCQKREGSYSRSGYYYHSQDAIIIDMIQETASKIGGWTIRLIERLFYRSSSTKEGSNSHRSRIHSPSFNRSNPYRSNPKVFSIEKNNHISINLLICQSFNLRIPIMSDLTIPFIKLSEKAKIPSQATPSDAGYDLFSTENYILKPGERKLFQTNISTAIPHGYYGRIAPRS